MRDIRLYKLVSGEEIIGTVSEEDETTVTLSKIRTYQMMQGQQGMGVAMLPWLLSNAEGEFRLDKSSTMGRDPEKISKEVEDNYIANTTDIALMG